MDVEIEASVTRTMAILKDLGFQVFIKGNGAIEGKLKDGPGRVHVLGVKMDDNKTYLDVHRDAQIHFVFIGVDYAKRPKEISAKILEYATRMGIKAQVTGGTNWFNRKNKALFRGIKV